MATKTSKATTRLELEIEKHRDESNWKKLADLSEQLKQRSTTGFDTLALFLLGESKLEQYLEENPPTESNIPKAKLNLVDPKRYLQAIVTVDQSAKTQSQQILTYDAWLLIGKINYAMGAYDDALNCFTKGSLEYVQERNILANRTLKIASESFAMKGLCLEKLPTTSTSKYKIAEREQLIVRCFEMTTELALLYLQEHDKLSQGSLATMSSMSMGSGSPLPFISENKLGPILETAIQRAPIIYIKNGDLPRAINQYRNVLSVVESAGTQNYRLVLARQLAEVLLRGVSEMAYARPELPISEPVSAVQALIRPTARLPTTSDSPLKPRRYSGHNNFVPKDENEEIILLLLICEAMSVREAVLSRSPEHKDARLHSYNNTTAIYDLLVITLARRAQFGMLCESFERAMKFSFEEFHIWFQFALSLISAGKHNRAVLVLKECMRLEANNALPCLMAAKICLENLSLFDAGVTYAQMALDRDKSQPQGYGARCHVALGLGYTLKADRVYQKQLRQDLLRKAFEAFHKALNLDPYDHLAEFYLALHFAQVRQIPEAIQHVKVALSLRSEHVNSLHLLVLLLSAQKQYDEALQLIEAALEEYPDNLNLMYTKAHLEEYTLGGDVALITSKHMLKLWKSTYEEQLPMDPSGADYQRSAAPDTRSIFQFYSSEVSDRDSSSLHAYSVAASRVEHTLSEVASSASGYLLKRGPQQAWLLQIQIWLLMARLYLKLNQISEAYGCVQEAATIFPLSHHIMYMKGLIHEHKREFNEAKTCFQNAIAINPLHIKSQQHLSMVYHYLGSNSLAEKTMRDAVKIDPMAHKSWYCMSKVLQALGEFDSASDCMATAIDLEATSPILPFSTIPRILD